jgi:hypothetical protein
MTDIITFDVKKPIENSINELVKNLSNDIEKKIREDITNNILMNITTKSIYGLDDIKDFGKLSDSTLSYIYHPMENGYNRNSISNIQCEQTKNYFSSFSPDNKQIIVFKENEYPILYYSQLDFSENRNNGINFYITNIIDGLLLSNDDILLLVLFSIKSITNLNRGNPFISFDNFIPSDNFIEYLVQNDYIDVGYKTPSFLQNKLDNSLRRYFASVHDNKIKAFEFDKLLEKYKELEISINNNKIELDEAKDKYEISNDENGMYKDEIKELIKLIKNTELEISNKQKEIIIDLEDKNKNLEEEIIKQSKKLKEIKEIEILNLEEEYNKLFTVFTETKDELNKTKEDLNKTKEENIKLSDKWLILKDETIKKFEEDNYKLRMEKDKLIKNNNELKKELGKILKENNNVNSK